MKSHRLLTWWNQISIFQILFSLFPIVGLAWMLTDAYITDGLEGLISSLSMMSFGAFVVGIMFFLVCAKINNQRHKTKSGK